MVWSITRTPSYALGEVHVFEWQYAAAVKAENAAVLGEQAMERMGLEAVQELEEVSLKVLFHVNKMCTQIIKKLQGLGDY